MSDATPADAADDAGDGVVTSVRTPIRLEYDYTPGLAGSRFLRAVREGDIRGRRCPGCEQVYVPPRGACPMCGEALGEEVEVADTGTVATFAIVNVSSHDVELPYVAAEVLLDGADTTATFLLKGVEPDEVRMGMRVKAHWKPPEERDFNLGNIEYVEPTGEPDADFETYKEQI